MYGHRFIVLSHPRSGSTLLTRALGVHPRIRMFGEIFNDEEEERLRAMRHSGPLEPGEMRADHYRSGQDAAEFLERVVFPDAGRDTAVGFKIFYRQGREDAAIQRAWDYLTLARSVRVIHLRRRNLLEALVSLRVAFLTNEWARPRGIGEAARVPPIHITAAECAAYFDEICADRRWAEDAFRGHEVLDVEYEVDLVAHFERTLHAIHQFLGVARGPAVKFLEKQGQGSMRDRIANFDELVEAFRGTDHAGYFCG